MVKASPFNILGNFFSSNQHYNPRPNISEGERKSSIRLKRAYKNCECLDKMHSICIFHLHQRWEFKKERFSEKKEKKHAFDQEKKKKKKHRKKGRNQDLDPAIDHRKKTSLKILLFFLL